MNRDNLIIHQLLFFFGGLYIASLGKIFLMESGFGVDPWMVFHMGISNHTPFTVGRATQVVGALMLLIGWALKIKPGIGTVMNMYFFGFFLDLNIGINNALNLVRPTESLIVSILYLIIGIIANGVGFGTYINGKLGAGPRDSFMLGISNVTGKKPGTIRTVMESMAALIGWLLGGPLGIGTLAYALSVGTVMQWTLDHVKLPQRKQAPGPRPL
ncbi:MAG: hypothetical protein WBJ82_04765 [Tepidanaerobacteraceae bacterium]|nr:membrane protein [Tepidanaerobacter sp.]HQA60224.1 hypothetical protein [Tepidanaerobacteraceae bacterium]HQE05979.1 hypothetical protein [Tepidanaerobacteraceae bacterium]